MTCHRLFRSSALEITNCVGDASVRKPLPMHFASFEAHFQDDGAYVLHEGHRSILIDVHYVELRRAGSTQTYSRPAVSVDRGMSIRFGSSVLDALLPPSDGPVDFPTGAVRLGLGEFRRLRALRRASRTHRAAPTAT
jgi:hypothetical protein